MCLLSYLPMHTNYNPGSYEANELQDLPYWSELYVCDIQPTGKYSNYDATRAEYNNLMRI